MCHDERAERKAGDDVKVQRGVRERPIERDEPCRPGETEPRGNDGQAGGREPDPHARSTNTATVQRASCDRVLPDEGEDQSDTRHPMREVEDARGGVG